MADYYPPTLTAKSRRLFETLRDWAAESGGVSVIGGWAVVELVAPSAAIASRDVDLVFRSETALRNFQVQAPAWRLTPTLDAADQRVVYALDDDPTGTIVVDVFTTGPWGKARFPKGTNVLEKHLPFEGLLPPLRWILLEKLRCIPERIGKDATDKQEKDILDVHRLVFHNRDAVPPLDLLPSAPKDLRREAGRRIERGIRRHPGFADDYRKVAEWLAYD